MKIIITESQLRLLTEAASLADDEDFRETIKSYENEVVNSSGKHYVFDDADPKNPKTFVSAPNKKRGGTLTIGWGHTGPEAKIGNVITKAKAEQLLTSDIKNEENKTKTLFPKYDTYPLYVRKALVNSVYRGEAKKGYKWVEAINAGNWEDAATKYLQGWDIDFSQAKNPKYKGGVADRMVTNQDAFKKYAQELKSKTKPQQTPQDNPKSDKKKTYSEFSGDIPADADYKTWDRLYHINKMAYPAKTRDTDYINLRYTPEVNDGFIDNKIGMVKYPNPIGIIKDIKYPTQNDKWFYVKLDSSVDAEDDYAWVSAKYVTLGKNRIYEK
jgi:GH24 family phage-related lysozyme (muramidase)